MGFLIPTARPDPGLLGRFGRLVYWVMTGIAVLIVVIFGISLLAALASPHAHAANLDPVFEAAGREWDVDPDLLRAIALANGSREGAAMYNKGGVGLMHITPKMAKALGATNPLDDEQSIFAGAKLMNYRLELAKHDVTLALEMYEGGADLSKLGAQNASYPAFVMSKYVNTRGTPAATLGAAEPDFADFLKRTGAVADAAPAANDAKAAEPDFTDFLKRTGAVAGLAAPPPTQASPPPLSKVPEALGEFVGALLVASLIWLFGRGARFLFAGE